MNSFWNLTGYEFKKIFKKKSTIITLFLVIVVTALSCFGTVVGYQYVDGEPSATKMESMQTDRAYARALAGREIDSKLLMETAAAYSKVPPDGRYTLTEEYETYARPYSQIFFMMRPVYNTGGTRFELPDLQAFTEEQADSYYTRREEKMSEYISDMSVSDASKAKLAQLNDKVKEPFVFDYTDGYTEFLDTVFSVGLLVSFAVAILLSPIFSGEYISGADQLLLSSRHGKKKLIRSKVFTAMTISGGLSLFMTLLTYFLCMLIFGFDGGGSQLQLFFPLSAYPLTMGQTALLISVCILLANLLTTALTLLLSAKLKSPFGVIVIISLLIIVPLFITIPENNLLLSNLLCLLPTNMMTLRNVISHTMFELTGLSVEPYIFMPIFAGVLAIILSPFAYRGFKNHQIG